MRQFKKKELDFIYDLENKYDGVYVVDKDRKLVYWNKRTEKIKGYRLPVVIKVVPIKGENSKIIGAVETFTDNDEKINLLEKIKRLKEENSIDELTGIGNGKHSKYVVIIADNIARNLDLSNEFRKDLYILSILHDNGMGVKNPILLVKIKQSDLNFMNP